MAVTVAGSRVVSTKNHTDVAEYVGACLQINALAAQLKAAEAVAKRHQAAALAWVEAHPSASVDGDGGRTLQVKHDGQLVVMSTVVKTKAKVVGDSAEVLAWCRAAGVKISTQAPEYLHSSTLTAAVKSGVVDQSNHLFELVAETTLTVK